MRNEERDHLRGYSLVKCNREEKNVLRGRGVFGLSREIRLIEPQKVYVRAVIETDGLSRVFVGVLENGKLYETRKGVGKGRTQTISVVHKCKSTDVGIRIIVDGLGEERTAKIKNLVFKPIGQTKVLKKTLDKIPYTECGYDNIYDDAEQKMPLLGVMSTEGVLRKEITCSKLEKGRQYYIKVLYEEITDCGEIRLEYGTVTQVAHEHELMMRFVCAEGKKPTIVLKADKYAYMVEIRAIMIAEAQDITMKDFADNDYFVNGR